MTTNRAKPIAAVLTLLLAIVALGGKARSQSVQVRGVINGRSGTKMTLQTDSGNVVVVLTGATQAQEVEGIFHARRKEMALAALVPGLAVDVQGSYNAQNQIVADTVKFKGSSLQTATDIQAGVAPVEQQAHQQQQEIAAQQAKLQAEQQEEAAQAAKIAANKAAIAAVNKRFGELDRVQNNPTHQFGPSFKGATCPTSRLDAQPS